MFSRPWRASFVIVFLLSGGLFAASQGGKPSTSARAVSTDPQALIGQLREAHQKDPADHEVEAYLGMLLYQKNPRDPEAQELLGSAAPHLPARDGDPRACRTASRRWRIPIRKIPPTRN